MSNRNKNHRFIFYYGIIGVISLVAIVFINTSAFAYGLGLSAYPLSNVSKRGIITTELTEFLSDETGVGLQARYLRKINPSLALEANGGVSNTNRSKRIGLAANFDVYNIGPHFLLRPYYERANEFFTVKHIFGVSPILTLSYAQEPLIGYPFVSLPISAALDSDTHSYEMRYVLSAGINRKFFFYPDNKMLLNLEVNINLKNSLSAFFIGVSTQL
ncbi:MAG: hypothetical protein HQK51_07470 [Oligoflexia bacterium]|nr:hypothetical protein [Oligoflexia bacterium]